MYWFIHTIGVYDMDPTIDFRRLFSMNVPWDELQYIQNNLCIGKEAEYEDEGEYEDEDEDEDEGEYEDDEEEITGSFPTFVHFLLKRNQEKVIR
jgi:hypothetical protein